MNLIHLYVRGKLIKTAFDHPQNTSLPLNNWVSDRQTDRRPKLALVLNSSYLLASDSSYSIYVYKLNYYYYYWIIKVRPGDTEGKCTDPTTHIGRRRTSCPCFDTGDRRDRRHSNDVRWSRHRDDRQADPIRLTITNKANCFVTDRK